VGEPWKAAVGAVRYSIVEPAREHPEVLLLSLSTMLITMGQGIVAPLLPLLVKSFGMTTTMVGIAVSAFALARVFSNIPASMLTRWRGARHVLVLGALFSAVGNLMVGLVPSYEALVGFRFVAGIGSAMYITAAVIFVAEVSTPENRGRLMTIYQASFLMGLTLGPSIGGLVAEAYGLFAPFYLVAGVSLAAAAWAVAKIPSDVARASTAHVAAPGSAGAAHDRAPSVFRNPGFIAINLIAMSVFLTRGAALFTLFPLLGAERFALEPGQLGRLFTVPAATNLVCQPFVGAMADRLGRKALITPTVGLFVASLLLSAVSPTLWVFALALALYGIAQAVEAPTANSYVADLSPPEQRAMAVGVYRTVADVGLVAGAPGMGAVADLVGIPWALTANAALLLVPGVLFVVLAVERPRESAPPPPKEGREGLPVALPERASVPRHPSRYLRTCTMKSKLPSRPSDSNTQMNGNSSSRKTWK